MLFLLVSLDIFVEIDIVFDDILNAKIDDDGASEISRQMTTEMTNNKHNSLVNDEKRKNL